jgi:hypothetical protein
VLETLVHASRLRHILRSVRRYLWLILRLTASVSITRLFERGLNIAEVSAISGHKELRMLQRYTHLRAIDLVSRLG